MVESHEQRHRKVPLRAVLYSVKGYGIDVHGDAPFRVGASSCGILPHQVLPQ